MSFGDDFQINDIGNAGFMCPFMFFRVFIKSLKLSEYPSKSL